MLCLISRAILKDRVFPLINSWDANNCALLCCHFFGYIRALSVEVKRPLSAAILDAPVPAGALFPSA